MLESIRALCLAAALLLVTASATNAGEQVSQGDLAPNWILADLEGQESSLYEGAEQDKWTVMVFCASWCSKCQQLLPKVQQLSQHGDSNPAQFYLMNVWEDKGPAALLEQQRYSLPVMRQAEHVARRYGIRITPGVVVVGPDKRIHYLRAPTDDVHDIATKLEQILLPGSLE